MSYNNSKNLFATLLTTAILAVALSACSEDSTTKTASDSNIVVTEATAPVTSEVIPDDQASSNETSEEDAKTAVNETEKKNDSSKSETSTVSLENAFEENTDYSKSSNLGDSNDSSVISDSSRSSDYSVCTTLSKEKVEYFAADVRSAIISGNWDALSQMVSYPIEIDGISVSCPEDFVNLIDDKGISDSFVSAIEDESCKDLFARDLGIMMGNGEVWFNQITDEDAFAITAFNGLLSE